MSPTAVLDSPRIQLNWTPRNEELVRLGLKHCTTRRTPHGVIGAVFEAGGEEHEIRAIVPCLLSEAAQLYFSLEGESSPTAFLEEWVRCYGLPREHIQRDPPVYVHIFVDYPAWSPTVRARVVDPTGGIDA